MSRACCPPWLHVFCDIDYKVVRSLGLGEQRYEANPLPPDKVMMDRWYVGGRW